MGLSSPGARPVRPSVPSLECVAKPTSTILIKATLTVLLEVHLLQVNLR